MARGLDINKYADLKYSIRSASIDDLPAIVSLLIKVWKESYQDFLPASFLDSLNHEKQIQRHRTYMDREASYYVCENAHQELLGFASVGPARGDSLTTDWELYTLYVDNVYHGQGIGSQLLETVIADIDRQAIAVLVMEKNPFRRFYEKQGFLPVAKEEMDLGEVVLVNVVYEFQHIET